MHVYIVNICTCAGCVGVCEISFTFITPRLTMSVISQFEIIKCDLFDLKLSFHKEKLFIVGIVLYTFMG
jgi:hypothetical protein